MTPRQGNARPEIEFAGVTFRHDSGPLVVADFNLEVRPGEFVVIIGPSGCGKTTVLNLAAGFCAPTAGEVRFQGHLIERPGIERPVVFQGDDSLYPWLTVRENVEFGLRMSGLYGRKERAGQSDEYLRMVGLLDHAAKFPHELSGGMKQRVQLARALVCKAQTILMDEPFGALDAQTRTVLQDDLVQISQVAEISVMFITHDIAEAILLGDRVCVMRAGPESNVSETFVIDLERPRLRSDPAFGRLYGTLNASLADQSRISLGRTA